MGFLHLLVQSKKNTQKIYTGYFMSDNEPDGIENATHNTFAKLCSFVNFDINVIRLVK
jgi:hypothetical protein